MKKFIVPILCFYCLFACTDEFYPDDEGIIRTCVAWDITTEIGECVSTTAYNVELDFKYTEQTNDSFELYKRGNELIDVYPLSALPIELSNFKKSGLEADFVKICIKDNRDCCVEFEFIPPTCVEETMLGDSMAIEEEVMMEDSMAIEEEVMMEDSMAIEEEVMMEDSMAIEEEVMMEDSVAIEEEVMMEDSMAIDEEVMIADSVDIGEEVMIADSMAIEEVMMEDSMTIEEEVMMEDSMAIEEEAMMEDSMAIEEEVMMEDSMAIDKTCEITALVADVGECNSEKSYILSINFEHSNPSNEFFDLFIREDELIGNYPLSELPIRLDNFNSSGLEEDYIKVCVNDQSDCCMEIEFSPPVCMDIPPTLPVPNTCMLTNLGAAVGNCTSDSTYVLTINFEYSNAGNEFFDLYVRGEELIDFFPLTNLPLQFDNFQASGLEQDYIKICINDNPDCCMEIEFLPPECIK